MEKVFRVILRLPEFGKDIKSLQKRFKTIEEDLRIFIKTELVLFHRLKKDTGGIFRISGIQVEEPKIYIAKKFACRALKGRGVHSGIRVVYAYFEEEDKIELIEIFYKGDKEVEDRERIIKNYKK
ncbi:MAG: hypothetical protein N2246_01840 [Candidatus Sumerlaeia bacterium]|nr:hypothetical protein [Candidatus Sumerlaeia bacterium]